MRRHNTLSVLLALTAIFRCQAASRRTKKRNETEGPSLAVNSAALRTATTDRSSTRAVRVRPDEQEDDYSVYSTDFRMRESPLSLADRLATIAPLAICNTNNEFANRLLSEQQQARIDSVATSSITSSSSISNELLWKFLASSALLLLASQLFLSPTGSNALVTVGQDLWKAFHAALSVGWLPWMWIQPAATPAVVAADVLTYVQLFGKLEVVRYLSVHVLPSTVQTFRKMLVAELWNRFWGVAFKQASAVFPIPLSLENTALEGIDFPVWVLESHSFLVGVIRKGTKKIFQSTLQKHLQGSIRSLFEAFYGAIRERLLQFT